MKALILRTLSYHRSKALGVKIYKGRTIRLQGGGSRKFLKKKKLDPLEGKKKKKLDPYIEGKKKLDPHGKKKKNLSWSGEKKTYPHIEEGSLCHRPSNCNLSNLCGLYKSLAPEIVSWFHRFAKSLAPPANSRAFGARASRSIFLAPPALVFGVNCLESSLWQRLWRRGKKYTWDLSYSEGMGEATLKRRVSFWSVTMTFPSRVQPAGGCFELQTLYGACRVFVLKSSKSQDILVKIGCFTQNGDLSNTHTHPCAHTQIQVWLLAFWCSCQICVI